MQPTIRDFTGSRTARILLAGLFGLLLSPAAASAQLRAGDFDDSQLFHKDGFRGHIVALDRRDRSLVVRRPNGDDERFELAPGARILGSDERLDIEALALNQEVRVQARLHGGERRIADFVTILDPATVESTIASEAAKVAAADTVTIVKVDVEAGTLSVRSAEAAVPATIRVDSDTVLLSGGRTLALSELGEGDRIVVTTRPDAETEPAPAARIVRVIDAEAPDVAAPGQS